MFRLCSVYVSSTFRLSSVYVLSSFHLCSVYISSMFNLHKSLFVLSMFILCSANVQSLFCQWSKIVQSSYVPSLFWHGSGHLPILILTTFVLQHSMFPCYSLKTKDDLSSMRISDKMNNGHVYEETNCSKSNQSSKCLSNGSLKCWPTIVWKCSTTPAPPPNLQQTLLNAQHSITVWT